MVRNLWLILPKAVDSFIPKVKSRRIHSYQSPERPIRQPQPLPPSILPQRSSETSLVPQPSPVSSLVPQSIPASSLVPQPSPAASLVPQPGPAASVAPQLIASIVLPGSAAPMLPYHILILLQPAPVLNPGNDAMANGGPPPAPQLLPEPKPHQPEEQIPRKEKKKKKRSSTRILLSIIRAMNKDGSDSDPASKGNANNGGIGSLAGNGNGGIGSLAGNGNGGVAGLAGNGGVGSMKNVVANVLENLPVQLIPDATQMTVIVDNINVVLGA